MISRLIDIFVVSISILYSILYRLNDLLYLLNDIISRLNEIFVVLITI